MILRSRLIAGILFWLLLGWVITVTWSSSRMPGARYHAPAAQSPA